MPSARLTGMPSAQPTPPQPPVTAQQPKEGSLLAGSISIKPQVEVKVDTDKLQVEAKPLVQDDLERYWHEVAEELGLSEVMKNATVRVGEHVGRFDIDAQTTYFADEFRPHKIDVLEALRRRSGLRMLDCQVHPLFVEQDEKVYSPDDKYNAMLQANENLAAMRHIFPEIDY